VKHFDWDAAKNANLTAERGIGFEEVVFHIERGDLLDIWEHRTATVTPASKYSSGMRPFGLPCARW